MKQASELPAERPAPEENSLLSRQQIIERETSRIIKDLQNDKVIKSGWKSVFQASPAAIELMGMTLVAASSDVATTINVEQSKKMADGAEQVVLPYQSLKANLQECTDLGRKAFTEAQAGMNELCRDAAFIIGKTGPIVRILNLLDNPKAAKHGLRPQINRLSKYAEQCEARAAHIEDGFADWLALAKNLKKAGDVSRGENRRSLAKNEKDREEKQHEEIARLKEEKRLETEIKRLEETVKQANNEAESAKTKVDMIVRHGASVDERLFSLPPMPVCEKKGGFFPGARKSLWGKNNKDVQWEDAAETRYQEKVKARNQEAAKVIELRRAELESARADALKRAELAKRGMNDISTQLKEAHDSRASRNEALLQTSLRIHSLQAEIEAMGNEKLTLDRIEEIIAESIEYLTLLKSQVQTIANFFRHTASMVRGIKERSLEPFLEEIHTGIDQAGGDRAACRIDKLELYEENREALMVTAAELQGGYFVMERLSGLYVDISRTHVMPGVNKIDELAIANSSKTPDATKMRELRLWSRDVRSQIDETASTSQEGLIEDTENSIRLLAPPPPGYQD